MLRFQYRLETSREENPEFVERLKGSYYVDDLASGERSVEEAVDMYEKAR